ncbi:MAG: serine/threonine-protein kinase [Elusimicrobiota bacterium]
MNSLRLAAVLLSACSPSWGANDTEIDIRPPSDFIAIEVDKASLPQDAEAVLTLAHPSDCGFGGIASPLYDARELDTRLIEYHPHKHQTAAPRKTLAPMSTKYSGNLTAPHRAINQPEVQIQQTHSHHIKVTRYSLKMAATGEVRVGPFEILCGGRRYRTQERRIAVSANDDLLYKTVNMEAIGGGTAPPASGPSTAAETQASPVPLPSAAAPLPPPAPIKSSSTGMSSLAAIGAGLALGLAAAAWMIVSAFKKTAPLPAPEPGPKHGPPPAPAPATTPAPTPPPTPPAAAKPSFFAPLSAGKRTIAGGRYEILEDLGNGGMGKLLVGLDTRLSRKVAIRQMRPEIRSSAKDCARFMAEARIIAKLRHPYIVSIHDILEEDDQVYLILDLVEGRSLAAILENGRKLPLCECKQLFHYICEAVDFAHRSKVLHRDLKPGNIMVNKEGFAMVTDFGIAAEAKDTISRMTQTDASGLPAYMAPEQHLGEARPASDVFALGVMLYEALTGAKPFLGPDFLAQKERQLFTPPSSIVESLNFRADRLMADALAPAPDQRPKSPLDLYNRLKEL